MEPIRFDIECWHAWQPAGNEEQPDVSFVAPLLRRRLGELDRIALACAQACHPGHNIEAVFCSRHGELHRTRTLLESIAQDEAPSPTAFGLSVHNAAAGLYSIAFGDTSPSTTIAAGADSLQAGLLEALVQSRRTRSAVMLVYAEETVPDLYHAYLAGQPLHAHGLAMRVCWNPHGTWQMQNRWPGPGAHAGLDAIRALQQPGTGGGWLQQAGTP